MWGHRTNEKLHNVFMHTPDTINSPQNRLLDVAKGVAMLIVILGHAIQGARHGAADVPLHRFILGFQMELFLGTIYLTSETAID